MAVGAVRMAMPEVTLTAVARTDIWRSNKTAVLERQEIALPIELCLFIEEN